LHLFDGPSFLRELAALRRAPVAQLDRASDYGRSDLPSGKLKYYVFCYGLKSYSASESDTCATFEAGRLARRRKPGEVFGLYFLLGQYVANLLHFANVIDRIHLLDVHRINALKPWPIQAFAGKLGEDSGAEIPRIPPPLHASSFRGPILFNFVALTHCSDGNRSDKRTRLVLPLTQHLPQSDFQCLCGFIEWK